MFELQGVGKEEFLTYKARPLVRYGNDVIYGDLSADAHVKMMIMNTKVVSGFEIPETIIVQLFKKDEAMPTRQFIAKDGLLDALDTAAVWLDGINK